MKKIVKGAIILNALSLGYGFYNGYFKNVNVKTKYSIPDFESKIENFIKNEENKKFFSLPHIKRDEMIKNLEEQEYDILIIRGGSAGAGVLINAFSSGLKAALIEKSDFSSRTSTRSTKLIHGGIRYLEEAA